MQEEEKKEVEQPAPEKETEEEPNKQPEAEEEKPDKEEPEAPAEPEGETPPADSEKETLMRELVIARATLEAMRSGVSPDAVEDAVILAVYALEQDGKQPDEKSIAGALGKVVERHPEWKAGKTTPAPESGGAEEQKKEPEDKKAKFNAKAIF